MRRLGLSGWILVSAIAACAASPAAAVPPELEDDPLHRLPLPGPLGVGIGWDAGPVYGFDRPLRVRGRMGLTLDLDGGWVGGQLDGGLEGRVRRARFHAQGTIDHWLAPDYRFQFGLEDRKVFLNDFYLRWRFEGRWLDAVQVGYFDPPTSLTALGSSAARNPMELAAPVAAFAPGYRLGVELRGTRDAPDVTWALNLSSVGQSDQNEADGSDSPLRTTGRLVWRPWHDDAVEQSLLHLGMSAAFTLAGDGALRYRARPESFLADYIVDTGDLEGIMVLLAFEAAWRGGPTSIESEGFAAFVDASTASAQLGGFSVQASRVLTGEVRPYSRQAALFGRIVPRHPFSPCQRRWGALEVAGRISWLDLDDDPVRGGRLATVNLGLVWTWNEYVRLHAGAVYARSDRRIDDGSSYVVQTRFELRM